jgi:hypothetical protein
MIINGNLNLSNSTIESLVELKEVRGNLELWDCYNLKSLGNLEKVNGNLYLNNCRNLKDLGNLKEIGELVLVGCENLKSPGKLKSLDKLHFSVLGLGFENLGLIKEISLDILSNLRQLKSFGNLKRIIKAKNGWSHKYTIPENFEGFNNNFDSFDFDLEVIFPLAKKIKSLNPIKIINGNLKIGGYTNTNKNQFNDISSLQYIQGDLDLYYYPNDILKINNSLEVTGKIFINSYTNPKSYENFPKRLKLKMIDKWEHELKKKG